MVFHKNKKNKVSLENQPDAVYVEKLPFNLKETLKNYRNIVKPSLTKTLLTMVSVIVLFIVFSGIFAGFDFMKTPYLFTILNNLSFFPEFRNVFILLPFTILLAGVTLVVAKQTPDLTSNFVNKSKFSGIFQALSFIFILGFILFAAGVSV